jgi:hypothetical protein
LAWKHPAVPQNAITRIDMVEMTMQDHRLYAVTKYRMGMQFWYDVAGRIMLG